MLDNCSSESDYSKNDSGSGANGKRHARYVFYALIIVIFFVPVLTRHSLVDGAKLFLIELMFLCGLLSLFVFVIRGRLFLKLHNLEEDTDQIRDEVVIQFTQGRASLNELSEKLASRSKGKAAGLAGLIKAAGPAMMFVLSKEKSMMRWGMFGLKMAKNIFDLYKERNKNR